MQETPPAARHADPASTARPPDTHEYFRAHAIEAVRKARAMPIGRMKQKQRTVAHVYHLLAKQAAFSPNLLQLDDFRIVRRAAE